MSGEGVPGRLLPPVAGELDERGQELLNRLNYAGYATHLSAADSTDYAASVVVDATVGQDPSQRDALLSILGLPASVVISGPDATAGWDYRVVLGYDYETCFKPEDLIH